MLVLAGCVGPAPPPVGADTLVVAIADEPDLDAPGTALDRQVAALLRRPEVDARFECALRLDPAQADPEAVLGDVAPVDVEHPTGPWRLASREPGRWRFLPNPAATHPPKLGALELLVLREPAERMLALKNHEVDLIEDLRAEDVDSLAIDSPETVVRRRGWSTVQAIVWQQRGTAGAPHPLFSGAATRRALTGAIDVDRMLRDHLTSRVYGDVFGRPAIGLVSPSLCGLEETSVARTRHDPEQAAAALAAAGWADSDGDGVLDQAGLPFRFDLLADATDPVSALLAEEARADLVRLGLDPSVELVLPGELELRLAEGRFDAAMLAIHVPPWPEAGRVLSLGGGDDRVTAELARVAAESGAPEAWRQWQRRVDEAHDLSFLLWRDDLVAVDSRFENTRIDLLTSWGDTERWTVAAHRVRRPVP